MGASGLILALTSDRTWAGALVTAVASGAGLCHAAQSALAVAGRGLFGFCWRYLTKIARQGSRDSINAYPNRMGEKPCAGERDR